MAKKSVKKDYFKGRKPIHKLSYCAFLDVLGFSDRIRASYKNNTQDDLLEQFHTILRKRIKRLKYDTDESLLYFKSFTDNIVLAHPRFSEDMESEFGFILWSISEYQYEMALKGFFIRGGLSVGPLFVDDNSVYGEALIEAYELESRHAVNPIVVLSDNTMKLVDLHIRYFAGETAPQKREVLVNMDGRYFINYLSECIIDTGEGEMVDYVSLKIHKEQIEHALIEYSAQPSVFAKFSWLSSYHNYFCDSVALYPGYSDKFKIDEQIAKIKINRINTTGF